MHTRFIPRLLVLSLMLTLVFASAIHFRALGAERIDWTETKSQENVLVQECGLYNITTSYTAEIAHHLITDNMGDEVSDQTKVDFAGSLGNAASGKSYQYDGHFTRWFNYSQSQVTITDLELRFEVGTPGEFKVAIDRVKMDLAPDPIEVIKTLVPNALQMELCYLLPGSYDWNVAPVGAPSVPEAELSVLPALVPSFDDRMGKDPSSNVHSENSALPGTEVDSGTEAMPSIQEIVYSGNSALPEPAETVPGYPDGCVEMYRHGYPC